jgi:hypothetical protein
MRFIAKSKKIPKKSILKVPGDTYMYRRLDAYKHVYIYKRIEICNGGDRHRLSSIVSNMVRKFDYKTCFEAKEKKR